MIELRRFLLTGAEHLGEEIALSPYYAVYRLAGGTPDGAYGEAFGHFFGTAVVAFGFALDESVTWCQSIFRATNLDNRLNLPIESRRTTFDQGNICGQAHFVDMPSRIQVI